jgi:hypothetical protein
VADLSVSNDEFLNAFHGSEVCYARMVAFMAEHDRVVRQYADAGELQRLIARRKSGWELGADTIVLPCLLPELLGVYEKNRGCATRRSHQHYESADKR